MIRRAAAVTGLWSCWVVGLLAACVLAAPARAEQAFLLPLAADAPLPLGAAWDRTEGRPMGEPGACMGGAGVERHDGGPTTWTLVVLSRAGGRLLVGLHVARVLASEGLAEARIPDAARRLAQRDVAEFRELCGDGFVAARALGGQYVAEVEIGPSQAPAASARLRTGVWTDPEPFAAALAELAGTQGAQARELPGGRRAAARPVSAEVLVERATGFADTVTEANALPYLAMVHPYRESAFAGTAITIDPTLGWGDAARVVFLHDAGGGPGGSAAAVRAAEMRKAVVQRRPGDPRRSVEPPAAVAAEPLVAAGPGAGAAEAPPAAIAVPAAPSAPVRRQRVAALVYEAPPGETPVFATTEPPPGVYGERVKQRVYWIPGMAAVTPAMRERMARAAASPPVRGTTIVVAEVGAVSVVLTDVAPAGGVYAEAAGGLRAWIAGVTEPDATQREALAIVARGGD